MKAKKSVSKKIMIIVLAIIVLSIALIACVSSLDSSEPEPVEKPDQYGLISEDYKELQAMVLVSVDDYVSDYDFSPHMEDWKFSKDESKDVFIISSAITLKESSKEQPLTCILTWNKDEEKYLVHFLEVGGTVFVDDDTV